MKYYPLYKRLVSILLPAIILLSVPTSISYALDIESVIPAYSAAFVTVKDIPKIIEAVKASPSWQDFLSQGKKTEKGMLTRIREFLGIDMWSVMGSVSNRASFVQINSWSLGYPTVIADLKDHGKIVDLFLMIEQLLGNVMGDMLKPDAGEYLGVKYGLAGENIRYAFLDNLFILAPGKVEFESIVDVYNKKEPSINQEPKYSMMADKIYTDQELTVYINTEVLNPIFQNAIRKDEMLVLGLYESKAIFSAISLFGTEKIHESYIYTGDSDSILVSFFRENGELTSPDFIPASSANIFCSLNISDPEAIWLKFINNIKDSLGEKDYVQFQDSISKFESETGLNFRDDILLQLTGEIGFSTPATGLIRHSQKPELSFWNGLLMFYEAKDRSKCDVSFERVFSPAKIKKTEYKGVKVHYVPTLNSPEGPVGYICIQALEKPEENMVVIGSLKRLQSLVDEEAALKVSEDFAFIDSKIVQPYSMMFYMDLRGLLSGISPKMQSDDIMGRIQELGSAGGSVAYDGQGLIIKMIGTQKKDCLETIGNLISLFAIIKK